MSKNTLLSNLINYISSNSSGNVVVAAPSSGYALDVTGTGRFTGNLTVSSPELIISTASGNGARMKLISTSANGREYQIGSNYVTGNGEFAIYDATASASRLTITSTGNVGIGTTTPNGKFNVSNGGAEGIEFWVVSAAATNLIQSYNRSTSAWNGLEYKALEHIFYSSGTERMRVNSGGDVKFALNITFGTTNEMYIGRGNAISGAFNSYDFVMTNFQSSGRVVITASTSGSSGVLLNNGSNSWAGWSDERLKTDLTPIENGIEKVSQLRSMIGRYKTDDESVSRSFLIAQDVSLVLPEATFIDERTGMYALQYTDVIPLLVASIKELKAELDLLKQQ